MKNKFPIPKSIEDVAPELRRNIFTEICGGTIRNGIGHLDGKYYITGDQFIHHDEFNPFVRIQDTKLCDPWVVGNEITIIIRWNKRGFDITAIRYGFTVGHEFSRSESFARMVAILKAWNKLQEIK